MIVTFQAIQNYIPDNNGNKLDSTISNSLKIFSSIFDTKYTPTPLEYFDIRLIDGEYTISKKDGVVLPETLVLPTEDINGNRITAIDNSFQGNQDIKKLIIPSTYTTIAPNAFQGSSITSIDMSNSGIDRISEEAFYDCSKLTSVKLPEKLKELGYRSFMNVSITSLVLPESIESLEGGSIYLTRLTSIYIPKNVNYIGSLVLNCKSIKKLVVDSDNSYYKDIDNVALLTKDNKEFKYFASGNIYYKEFHIPEGVEKLCSYSFHMCIIYDLYLPSTLNNIDINTFGAGSRFANIYVDSSNTTFASILDNSLLVSYNQKKALKYCVLNNNLPIVLPESIEEMGVRCFDGYSATYITINKNLKIIEGDFLTNSSTVTSIYVDEGNTYFKSIDNKFSISNDGKILYRAVKILSDSCIVPDGIEDIIHYSLSFVYSKSIEFPSSLKYLNGAIFFSSANKNYSSLVFNSITPPHFNTITFTGINIASTKIYVPDSAVNAYKSDSNWSKYSNNIYPISQKN